MITASIVYKVPRVMSIVTTVWIVVRFRRRSGSKTRREMQGEITHPERRARVATNTRVPS